MTYGDYLHLDQILGAQHPRSPDHNEMLFIIQHQTSELWIKLMLQELRAARDRVAHDELQPAFKMLARVSRIMEQLVHAWDVLSTLTPTEYSALRPYLGSSSGFQSFQYRELEFILGNKMPVMVKPHAHRADLHERVRRALQAPSLYDEAIRLLVRKGFAIDAGDVERDWSQPREFSESLSAGLARGLSQAGGALGPLPAGGGVRRPGGRLPAVAVPSRDHGRAHHRLQDRHRWHRRRRLPEEDAGRGPVSRALEGAHRPVRCDP